MTVEEYQNFCAEFLRKIYPDVKTEWSSFGVNKIQFSPRLDIAVGPFAIHRKLSTDYDKMLSTPKSKKFINLLIKKNNENVKNRGEKNFVKFSDFSYFNYNARCFISVEIENKVSRKHLIGGLVNASVLGRVAVLVAWTPDKLEAFFKLKNYLIFLSSAEKNSFRVDNILIVDKDQFLQICNFIKLF